MSLLDLPISPKHCHCAPCSPNSSPYALCFLPGMPLTPLADKVSHGLCLFLRYLYTFTMIPFFALLAPDHELPSIQLQTYTVNLISISPLIFDAPLLLGISCSLSNLLTLPLGPHWNLSVLAQLQPIVVGCEYHPLQLYFIQIGGQLFNYHSWAFPRVAQFSSFFLNGGSVQLIR